jgi:hypothetical protein
MSGADAPIEISLSGSSKAIEATKKAAVAEGVDLTAFGIDPDGGQENSKSAATASGPYGDCVSADAFDACTADLGDRTSHLIINAKCAENLVRIVCRRSKSGEEGCSGSSLRYNPGNENSGSSADSASYSSAEGGVIVVLYNRPDTSRCVRRILDDYDAFLNGSGVMGPNYRTNLEADGIPYH